MNPGVKLATRIIAVIFLLILVCAVVFALWFDANNYRQQLNSLLSEATGYDTQVGNIEWQMTRPNVITFEQVTLSQAKQVVASIPLVSAHVELKALLDRDIYINNLVVSDPNIKLAIAASAENAEQQAAETHADTALPFNSFYIKRFSINHLELDLQYASQQIQLQDVTFKVHDWAIAQNQQWITTQAQVSLELAAKSLRWQHLQANKVFIAAELADQNLQVSQLAAEMFHGHFDSRFQLNFEKQLKLVVEQASLHQVQLEYDEQMASLFAPYPAPEVASIETKPTEQPLFSDIMLQQVSFNEVSFTSYQAELPLTFNRLSLELQGLPIRQANQWLNLSQSQQLATQFELNAAEVFYGGTSLSEVHSQAAINQGVLLIEPLKAKGFKGHLDASLTLSLTERPDVVVNYFVAEELDIGIQPQWLPQDKQDVIANNGENEATPNEDANNEQTTAQTLQDAPEKSAPPTAPLPINSLLVKELKLKHLNVLSFADALPLSVRGIDMTLTDAWLVKDGRLIEMPPSWSQDATFELSIKESIFNGFKSVNTYLKGKLNLEYLNQQTLQRIFPSESVVVEGVVPEEIPTDNIIRLD
ncbi:AsmA family protein [Motilimonas pumila]|uniref:AsmA family protein n=1 Tax=Motilimonas pumila TaxID=2303987 RepID=A0A418YH41_9GAMM|nr:AsmA family protein [Motilimonas pumila]RJG49405.1 AsmA family protein [Motilimonas pumila]